MGAEGELYKKRRCFSETIMGELIPSDDLDDDSLVKIYGKDCYVPIEVLDEAKKDFPLMKSKNRT